VVFGDNCYFATNPPAVGYYTQKLKTKFNSAGFSIEKNLIESEGEEEDAKCFH